jgi:hypothetical protein
MPNYVAFPTSSRRLTGDLDLPFDLKFLPENLPLYLSTGRPLTTRASLVDPSMFFLLISFDNREETTSSSTSVVVLLLLLGLTQVWISTGFQQNPLKLSALLVNQKATLHRVHNAVSPEIALWVTAIPRCLQSRNEWGSGSVFYLSLCIKLVIDSSISKIHSSLALCMHANTSS